MNVEQIYFTIIDALQHYTFKNFNIIVDKDLITAFDQCIEPFSHELTQLRSSNASNEFIQKWIAWITKEITNINYYEKYGEKLAHYKFEQCMQEDLVPLFSTGMTFLNQYKTFLLPIEEKIKLEKNLSINQSNPALEKSANKI